MSDVRQDIALGRSDTWEDLVAKAQFDSPLYEPQFVLRVLSKVPGLQPSMVRPQQPFRDARGRSYRMDFAIVEEPFVHIALEVDGYDKRGRGTGMTYSEFEDWLTREAELKSQGWDVLRFANTMFMREPAKSARFIELTLLEARAVASDRLRLQRGGEKPQLPAKEISAAEALELGSLREDASAELDRVRSALRSSEAENSRMGRVAIGLGILFAGALVAGALVLRTPSTSPTAAPSTTPLSGGAGVSPISGRCPAGFPIKGNVTATEKIYHLPGQAFYDTTNPERCFSTETAAQAEGFRRSQR